MNDDCSHFIDYYSNYTTPTKISLNTITGKIKYYVEPNELPALKSYKLTRPEIISITTTEGIELNAAITKPTDFNPSKKYPVLFTIYGGPGSQIVKDEWKDTGYLWRQLLTQKGH